MYTPPTYERAQQLVQEMEDFLAECGGVYKERNGVVRSSLILAVATGQFRYKRGCYFVSWWNLDESGLAAIDCRVIPVKVWGGKHLYIADCGVKRGYFRDMLKAVNKATGGYKRGFWLRAGR